MKEVYLLIPLLVSPNPRLVVLLLIQEPDIEKTLKIASQDY